jgi:hypothetical protein
MQAKVQVELACGIAWEVEHDVKTLPDFRKLLKKADAKIVAACRAMPEIAEMKLARARITVEQPKQAAAAS